MHIGGLSKWIGKPAIIWTEARSVTVSVYSILPRTAIHPTPARTWTVLTATISLRRSRAMTIWKTSRPPPRVQRRPCRTARKTSVPKSSRKNRRISRPRAAKYRRRRRNSRCRPCRSSTTDSRFCCLRTRCRRLPVRSVRTRSSSYRRA